jgi:proline iminopeptidase
MRKLLTLFALSLVVIGPVFSQEKDDIYYSKLKLPGVKMITVAGKYRVWTQKIGDGKIKLLLLHGGPGLTHEYLEDFADYLPQKGIEIYLYEQLGSYFSDQPEVSSGDPLWKMPARVQEIEDVRKGLGLRNFYLYGHSWGAVLGLAYSIKYQRNLKGFIFSSMNLSQSALSERQKGVRQQVDIAIENDPLGKELIERKNKGLPFDKAAYDQLFTQYYARQFIARTSKKLEVDDREEKHRNNQVMDEIVKDTFDQDYLSRLSNIKIPVLLIAGQYDPFVSPTDLEQFHKSLPLSRLVICPDAGHMAMLDSPKDYFPPIIEFLKEVEAHRFKP